MIICGFPGTGKSTMAKFSQWVDLESTPFKKNWLLYAEVAKHMSDNGYTVMVSTHEEMLNALEQIETNYVVVIPPITDKATYLHRYDMRGNTYDFIRLLDENWEKWITAIVEKPTVLKTIVVLPKDGCIKAFAEYCRFTDDNGNSKRTEWHGDLVTCIDKRTENDDTIQCHDLTDLQNMMEQLDQDGYEYKIDNCMITVIGGIRHD